MASERLTVIVKLPRERRLCANPQRAGKNESTAQAAWAVQYSLGSVRRRCPAYGVGGFDGFIAGEVNRIVV